MIEVGAAVTATPDDSGREAVKGILDASDDREVIVGRSDPRTGTLHVHFARAGYDLMRV